MYVCMYVCMYVWFEGGVCEVAAVRLAILSSWFSSPQKRYVGSRYRILGTVGLMFGFDGP